MWAGVAQSKRESLAITADYQRDFQQCGLVQLISMYAICRQSAVPKTGKHQGVAGLALRKVKFGHGKKLKIF